LNTGSVTLVRFEMAIRPVYWRPRTQLSPSTPDPISMTFVRSSVMSMTVKHRSAVDDTSPDFGAQ